MHNVGEMKLGKRENLDKTPKIPTLPTIVLLATPKLEIGIPVGIDAGRVVFDIYTVLGR